MDRIVQSPVIARRCLHTVFVPLKGWKECELATAAVFCKQWQNSPLRFKLGTFKTDVFN